jgi:hypothetical protein
MSGLRAPRDFGDRTRHGHLPGGIEVYLEFAARRSKKPPPKPAGKKATASGVCGGGGRKEVQELIAEAASDHARLVDLYAEPTARRAAVGSLARGQRGAGGLTCRSNGGRRCSWKGVPPRAPSAPNRTSNVSYVRLVVGMNEPALDR